jgi:hypothetical protein
MDHILRTPERLRPAASKRSVDGKASTIAFLLASLCRFGAISIILTGPDPRCAVCCNTVLALDRAKIYSDENTGNFR